ncbi:hypothetical protein CORC01_00765 [Colletotrichum orchidophilum]|uniref:Peptidase M43 pregnancy-associated plasma-A domain-containing protein n=1 Tax=Colletotrichum orchidophilum TaxID=1209926 RepID=A0A1G4BRA9_9PEZI|nr:uncharacterized protein CORC01_00765 [Colletotrichum orchidophilum]OHF03903.1 hypothetical protein CORC01_00765 [Colletotrichum orchidophilum]
MKFTHLFCLISVLSSGASAQNFSNLSTPDAPASSVARPPAPASSQEPAASPAASSGPDNPPEASSVVRPPTSEARPISAPPSIQIIKPSSENPAVTPKIASASSGASVSPNSPKEAASSTQVTLSGQPAPTRDASNSGEAASSRVIVQTAGPSASVPKSNTAQRTQVQSDAPRVSGGSTFVQVQGTGTTTAAAIQASGTQGINIPGDDSSSQVSGTGSLGASQATYTISSPELATTASFAAQPSDSFQGVNETSILAVPESGTATPPDKSTIQQFQAELNANIPAKSINNNNARALAILETAYFEYFAKKDPAPVDMGKISIPANISECQNLYSRRLAKRKGLVDELLDWVPLASRDLRGFSNCKAVDAMEVGVYFHYMRASSTAARPNELEARVKSQVDVLNEALGAVRINFRFMALNWWEPKANEDWSKVTRRESKLLDWQRRTRAPGKLTLTVWIVNGLRSTDKNDQELNSYVTFPNQELDEVDGIVIEETHVQGGDATTLVHDVGHWFGLGHTFNEIGQQCLIQDGLTNATQTSGNQDVVYQCSQVTCAGGSPVDINNYMSYSSCRGQIPQNGFTTDQKARMFANALEFRRGYEPGECMPDGKASVRKRSSMQDLLDGKCPDISKQANILTNTPYSLGVTLFGPSAENLVIVAWVWAAVLWVI